MLQLYFPFLTSPESYCIRYVQEVYGNKREAATAAAAAAELQAEFTTRRPFRYVHCASTHHNFNEERHRVYHNKSMHSPVLKINRKRARYRLSSAFCLHELCRHSA
jgi:hypothetical protein